ncbi:5' nucleotidase, NT5C type [Romboutsia sp.]|uniref:5' nucleotidase, NT5C type n=1 Tax=Romboutsia sp. TaxID=1965302 RepID=UPI003F364C7D
MSKLNICIDIDGTITSPYHFIPYLNELYNKNITEIECITYDWEALYGMDMDTILNEFHENYLHSYEEAKIVDYAKEIIDKLRDNHNLYFVTARNQKLTDITTKWLHKNGFAEIDVYLLGSDYKIKKAKELECHIFIEDNPFNAMQLANEDMKVLLIDANYNKDIAHKNITRVNNWIDIEKFIESVN